MTIAHKSTRLSMSNASPVLPEGMLLFPLDGRVNDTLDSIPVSINTSTFPKYEYKFSGSVAVEDSTTNLITNGNFSDTSNWGLSISPGSAATFTTDGTWGRINVPAGETGYFYYLAQDVARTTPANTPVTWSVTFRNNTVGKFSLRLVMFVGGTAPQQPQVQVDLDGSGIPKTYFVTAKHTVDSTALRFDILAGSYYSSYGGLSNTSIEFSYAMGEQRDHSTSFVNGYRPLGVLKYDISSLGMKDAGCVSCWIYNSDGMVNNRAMNGGVPNNQYLLKLGSSASDGYKDCVTLRLGGTPRTIDLLTCVSSSTASSVSGPTLISNLGVGSWNHFVMQWDKNGLPSGNNREFYINGILENGDATTNTLPASILTILHLGNWDESNALMPCTYFEQLAIHPSKGFAPDVIESWYKSNAPFFDPRDAFVFV